MSSGLLSASMQKSIHQSPELYSNPNPHPGFLAFIQIHSPFPRSLSQLLSWSVITFLLILRHLVARSGQQLSPESALLSTRNQILNPQSWSTQSFSWSLMCIGGGSASPGGQLELSSADKLHSGFPRLINPPGPHKGLHHDQSLAVHNFSPAQVFTVFKISSDKHQFSITHYNSSQLGLEFELSPLARKSSFTIWEKFKFTTVMQHHSLLCFNEMEIQIFDQFEF